MPRISVTELVDAELTTDRLTLTWQGLFQIDDAGLFQLRLEIPEDFEVRSIVGKAISGSRRHRSIRIIACRTRGRPGLSTCPRKPSTRSVFQSSCNNR